MTATLLVFLIWGVSLAVTATGYALATSTGDARTDSQDRSANEPHRL
ncbi:hypothetical protein ACIBEF_06840 [Micromonospora sp. NPDC050795]